MPTPRQAILTWTAVANGGLTPLQLVALMEDVPLYGGGNLTSAPPPNATELPGGTSDALWDVLYGANVSTDATGIVVGSTVARVLTLDLQPSAGAPTAPSFVSLGTGSPTASAPTNNPPLPSPLFPFPTLGAGAASGWTGSAVSSSPADNFNFGPGTLLLVVHYLDVTGAAQVETIDLNGTTPVNFFQGNKYVITDVEQAVGAAGYGPFGQVGIWSGPVDEVTGQPTGILVGYLPNSFYRNFSFQQLTSWTPSQVADIRQAYSLVPPDFNYPDQTVPTTPPAPPPPPSKYILDYPPPSSIVNPGIQQPSTVLGAQSVGKPLPQGTLNVTSTAGFANTGTLSIFSSKGLQRVAYTGITPTSFTGCSGGTGTLSYGEAAVQPYAYPYQPNFATPNEYLSETFFGGLDTVANPFQGLFLGAFAKALAMPASRAASPGTVSMTVQYVF